MSRVYRLIFGSVFEEISMADEFYPAEINELPEIDIPFSGVRGRLLQGPSEQLIFFDIEPIGGDAPQPWSPVGCGSGWGSGTHHWRRNSHLQKR